MAGPEGARNSATVTLVGRDRTVGIVDYQAGNIHSIDNAFEHLGANTVRIREAADFAACTHVVLPGVGAFGFCSEQLQASGLLDELRRWALDDRRPMLGICVGMQLMADASEESPDASGLGWIGGRRTTHSGAARPSGSRTSAGIPCSLIGPSGSSLAGSTADFYFDHSYAYQRAASRGRVGSCAPWRAIQRDRPARQHHRRRSFIPRRASQRGCASSAAS